MNLGYIAVEPNVTEPKNLHEPHGMFVTYVCSFVLLSLVVSVRLASHRRS